MRPLLPAVVMAAVNTCYFLCFLISPNVYRPLRGKRQENGLNTVAVLHTGFNVEEFVVYITSRVCRDPLEPRLDA